jgi:hypothetical protein
VIGTDERRIFEPEAGKLGQNPALVRNQRRQNEVEGRNPVGGDDQELVVEFIDVADLAFFIKTKFRENDIGKGLVHGAFS